MAASRGVDRVLSKLNRSVQEGKYYEAHQMYRTLYFRYKAQKKYAEAIDLLYNGSLTMLQHNQHGSGSDLALLLVEVLKESNTDVTDQQIDRVARLHQMIDADSVERANLVISSLTWTKQKDQTLRSGHPRLHQQLATTFWKEKSYAQARYHFIHTTDGEGCAVMLVEFNITAGFPSEADLFIAQAVFQYLCLKNKPTAQVAFTVYTQQHPHIENGPPFVRPLLNFLWLLLLAVESGKLAVFTVLCEQYQPSLKRDPTYNEYLDKIGQVFFGIPPPAKSSQQGLFGNLMSSLFSMGPEGDEVEAGSSQLDAAADNHQMVTDEDLD